MKNMRKLITYFKWEVNASESGPLKFHLTDLDFENPSFYGLKKWLQISLKNSFI